MSFLISSYGIDSALSQILYFHHTKERSFFTCSKKRIEEAIQLYKPTHILGFGVDLSYLTDAYIIDREKEVSATANLGKLLNVDRSLFKYAAIANSLIAYNGELEVVYNYYEAVGHEQFVNKFISTDSLTLTKVEQDLGKLYVVEHQNLAKNYIEQFCYYKDDIAICRSNFRLSKYIEEMIIDSYAESGLKFIVTYQFNYTGKDIVCTVRSKKDLIKSFMEAVPDKNYCDEYDNSIVVKVDELANIEEQIYDVVSDICDHASELEKKKAYDRYDKLIQH